jgi:hypothetical protein
MDGFRKFAFKNLHRKISINGKDLIKKDEILRNNEAISFIL